MGMNALEATTLDALPAPPVIESIKSVRESSNFEVVFHDPPGAPVGRKVFYMLQLHCTSEGAAFTSKMTASPASTDVGDYTVGWLASLDERIEDARTFAYRGSGLEALTPYEARLAVVTRAGQGAWSDTVFFTTMQDKLLPALPRPTLRRNTAAGTVSLSWTRPGNLRIATRFVTVEGVCSMFNVSCWVSPLLPPT